MKTLIFGPENVGKTSLLKTTCSGYRFIQTIDIPPTKGISRENYLFRGLLELTLWDAGGQEKYQEKYFTDRQRESIFSEVEIPVFMIDASSTNPRHFEIFKLFLRNIMEFSPGITKIHVLINKTDLPDSNPKVAREKILEGLNPREKKMCSFTPVSVKEGSAQKKLIEILDEALEKAISQISKHVQIRQSIESLKTQFNAEIFLINRPDGLLTASTLGSFRTDPLNFLVMESGIVQSNLDSIFSVICHHTDHPAEPLFLQALLFETEERHVILKEIEDSAAILIVSNEKTPENLMTILTNLNKENTRYRELAEVIKHR